MAARARAARAYAGHEQKEVAEALGISVQTYKRIEAGQRDLTDEEAQRLAAKCTVPAAFMQSGFDRLFDGADVEGAVERVNRQIRELWQEGLPASPNGEVQRRVADALGEAARLVADGH
jgi:transcriptional regulator with XRE-family HTH domain